MTHTTVEDNRLQDLLTKHGAELAELVQVNYFPYIADIAHMDMSDAYLTGESAIVDGEIQTTLSLHWARPTADTFEQARRTISERFFETSVKQFAKRFQKNIA